MSEVKDVVDCIKAGVSFAVAIDESQENGFQLTDLFSLVPSLTLLPEAIKDIANVPEQIRGLDDEGKAEIEAEIEKLELNSDWSEEVAEQALFVMMELGRLITILRKAKKQE
jgi:hypothetical protein